MNVLIIPEDFRNDQYILRPLFQRLFRSLNRTATVTVCTDPLLGGVSEALKSERLAEIIEQYDGMTDLFILCVDRDGDTSRRTRLDQIEQEFGIPLRPVSGGKCVGGVGDLGARGSGPPRWLAVDGSEA